MDERNSALQRPKLSGIERRDVDDGRRALMVVVAVQVRVADGLDGEVGERGSRSGLSVCLSVWLAGWLEAGLFSWDCWGSEMSRRPPVTSPCSAGLAFAC
jgi:hypothetical protein